MYVIPLPPQPDIDSTPLFKNEWKKVKKHSLLIMAAFLLFVLFVFSLLFFIIFQIFFDIHGAVIYSLIASSLFVIFLVLFNRPLSPEDNMFYSSARVPAVSEIPVEKWVENFLKQGGNLYTRKQKKILFHQLVTFTLSNGLKIEILRWPNGLDVRIGPEDELNENRLEELRTGISRTVSENFRKGSLKFLNKLADEGGN